MYVVILESVDLSEIAGKAVSQELRKMDEYGLQVLIGPLYLLNRVQRSMHNELIHVLRLISETSDTASADLGSPEVQLEEWVIPCADDGEVVGHRRPRNFTDERRDCTAPGSATESSNLDPGLI